MVTRSLLPFSVNLSLKLSNKWEITKIKCNNFFFLKISGMYFISFENSGETVKKETILVDLIN